MIDTTKYAYSPLYDIYVSRETMLLYKRNSRRRKTEIKEDELVLVKLYINIGDYITFNDTIHNTKTGVWHIFADAFPERVTNYADHLADFITFSELDHLNGHATYESNFPENLRWSSPRVNRARTSRTLDVTTMTDKQRERVLKRRKQSYDSWFDPEKIDEHRRKDAERKRKYYAETKSLRKQQADELNAKLAELAAKTTGQL